MSLKLMKDRGTWRSNLTGPNTGQLGTEDTVSVEVKLGGSKLQQAVWAKPKARWWIPPSIAISLLAPQGLQLQLMDATCCDILRVSSKRLSGLSHKLRINLNRDPWIQSPEC